MDHSRSIRGAEQPRDAGKRSTGTRLPIIHRQDNAWLQGALAAGTVLAFQWDARARISQRSANAAEILGFGPDETVTAERFLARIHPADRRLLNKHVRNLRPDNPTYTISFRFERPDGRHLWLEETSRAEFDSTGRVLRLRGLTRDISLRRRLDEHQAMLLTELNHRVKNVLSRVAVVVSATRGQATSVDEYATALEGRIASLVNAHELVGQTGVVNLAELARRQLAPYAAAGNSTLAGPNVTLSPDASEAMAVVLHELVTNAAKHGALSVTGGHVTLQWHRDFDGSLNINWREVGGPAIASQPAPSYGISLIRDLVPHELAGKVEFQFKASGVNCIIKIPAEHLQGVATVLR